MSHIRAPTPTLVFVDKNGRLTMEAQQLFRAIIGTPDSGWTAMTGTGSKGALTASAAGTASAGYVQAELQAALNRVAALEARLRSLDETLINRDLIGQ